MPLSPTEIVGLSRLLDVALALTPGEREAWLAALPDSDRAYAPRLRAMLQSQEFADAKKRLATLPRLAVDDELARSGDRVGPYLLMREIGRGGMGSVWLAQRADGSFEREVALKLPRLAWGAGLAERMAREREIGMLLEHPAIARLYDAGLDERGRPYLALEYIVGEPLDAWCDARALPVRARLRLFLQVVRAVAYAHGRLVVHRDLKPSNVLVSSDGQTHLLDFGIAKRLTDAIPEEPGLTQREGRVMTPHYASPEQVAGEPITVASDIYSLGVLLYEVLTGTLPIASERNTAAAVEDAVLHGEAPPSSSRVKDRAVAKALRGEVDAILAKAMQRQPDRRYATADALALDIERHLNGEPVSARPDSRVYRLRKVLRRHWMGVTAVAAVLLAVLSGSGVALVQAQRAARSAERERVVKAFVTDVFRINSQVDPKNAALRPASPQSLLEGGAQLIQQRFSGEPELQAELFGVVGGVFSDMGAYKQAADYATKRIEVLTLLRAEKTEQAKALLALGKALLDDERFRDAEPRIRRAREMAGKDATMTADATLSLSRTQFYVGNWVAASSTLSEAEAMLARSSPGPSTARAWATSVRANLLFADNRLDEAIPVYQQAIDIALASEGPLSLTAIDIELDISLWLSQTAHSDLARRYFDAAVSALRKLGGAHEARAAYVNARFAERLGNSGGISASQAIAALESSRASLTSMRLPIPEWWLPRINFWLGSVKARQGDIAHALPLMDASAPLLRASLQSPWQRFTLAGWLGATLSDAGQHERADVMLREMREARRETGATSHPYAAEDFASIAQNLLKQGRYREAEDVLDEAPRFAPMKGEGGHPDRYNRMLVWTRAHVRLASGDSAAAIALLKDRAPGADELAQDRTVHGELLGEALCLSDKQSEGLALLKRHLAERERADSYPYAPWLARLRALAGRCALGLGDRQAAQRYAALARAAFTAQPGVSAYYKAPLFKLERSLRLQLPAI
jgi:serine/threonine protein kinase